MSDKIDIKKIYDENKDLVFNLSLSYIQNILDAEEITQDVFIKIYMNLNKFSNNSKISTWIYKITINTCLDFIKAKKTKKRIPFLSSLFHQDSNEPIQEVSNFNHPGIEIENKEALENLFNLINTLPDRQKTIIILSKIEDKSQKEISEIMNISIKAVESLLQRAKKSLKEKLTDKNEGKD
jgi:RNA polymerase sigma-70 factor (ECF subfamily)